MVAAIRLGRKCVRLVVRDRAKERYPVGRLELLHVLDPAVEALEQERGEQPEQESEQQTECGIARHLW